MKYVVYAKSSEWLKLEVDANSEEEAVEIAGSKGEEQFEGTEMFEFYIVEAEKVE